MQNPRKKRKSGVSIVPGPCSDDTSHSTPISKALLTHTTRHWGIKKDGTVTHHRSHVVLPSGSATAWQVGSGYLGRDWYSSLFRQPTSVGEELDLLVNDVDGPTQYDPVVDEQVVVPFKRLRLNPMHEWKRYVQLFLDEIIRLDGRGDFADQSVCGHCKVQPPLYQCRDCDFDKLCCRECIVNIHSRMPLHRIEHWQSDHFVKVALRDLGLRIQLGHPSGESCDLPTPSKGNSFLIIDIHGIHEVSLDYCGCEKATNILSQLLRYKLYPATVSNPQTAATFRVLERFHILNLESKCSAHEFYRSLARETDNTGLLHVRDRYTEFLRMIRQWRHLKMLKRAGLGHDTTSSMEEGCCAVLCPACPQPGKNLPDNWADAAPDEIWKYTSFLAADANFQQRCKNISNEEKDPSLCDGMAYFVRYAPYMAYLNQYKGDKQPVYSNILKLAGILMRSTCVSHDAVNRADTKDIQGCVVTGLGAVDCARHDFRRPNSVGDLQAGERYLNMDYMYYAGLKGFSYRKIFMSYDIACQWGINFKTRMAAKFPANWSINNGQTEIKMLVPKFHLPAHIEKCQRDFSFNYTRHVGRTDGEAPERGWSKINGLAASTREMGPGSRRDLLEDHMGDSNWKKVSGMGLSLLRKIKEAISQKAEHTHYLEQLEGVIPTPVLGEWTREVDAWENDNTNRNPLEPRVKVPTQNEVRLALARRDAELASTDCTGTIHCEITGSMMIHMGLELEEQQRKVRIDIESLGPHATALQRARIQERVTALRKRITSWFEIQALYIPGTTLLRVEEQRTRTSSPTEIQLFDVELWLPSTIAGKTSCDHDLQEIEWELRKAQANDALDTIRQHLRIDSFLTKRKKDWSRGVRANTRSLTLIEQNRWKMKAVVGKYRAAYKALDVLGSITGKPGSWKTTLRVLNNEDIRGLPVDGLGEGYRTLSWIWMAPGVFNPAGDPDEDAHLHDALRIQWYRARARKMRWMEEVELLVEEMHRVRKFLEWHAKWWVDRANRRGCIERDLQEGLSAYAHRQASMRRQMKGMFEKLWQSVELWAASGKVTEKDDEDQVLEPFDKDTDKDTIDM